MNHPEPDSATLNPVTARQSELLLGVEQLMTSADVARCLRTTPWHVNELVRSGRLRCVEVGERTRRFRRRDVASFIEEVSR